MAKKDGAPSAQVRPVFSFSFGSRNSFSSKWDDAEKWLINGHHSPANFMLKKCGIKQEEKHKETEVLVADKQQPKIVSLDCHHGSSDRDKYTNEQEHILSKLQCLGTMEVIQEVKNRDTGTEMTPVGSSGGSRCPTPPKSLSPPRHNTPESGALFREGLVEQSSSQLECHLAKKLQPWTPFDAIGSAMEEEEAEISKSLRQFEISNGFVISGPRPSAWEEQELLEPCLRYQMTEAKIQAWVNLQKAKAEAQARKLEVKIHKMRSKHEEKMMKKMTIVDRKAEELRAAARRDHSEMVGKSNKTPNHHRSSLQFSGHRDSCGCLISN
ncbi:hypothetical protein SSX86_002452 [Deinandra increscens subsp. villosa]|uniref:Remorin C-terminal domain-containing protein n=1 Tax=Deinandra increscens subsp. villosa TaxID=3103831 RepID=A0AAP0DS95_9ASTR